MTSPLKIAIIEQTVRRWTVPPICQGQIVEVSYGDDYAGGAYRRTYDHSDRTVSYAVADMASCGCDCECDCWDPANTEPVKFDWRPA